MQKLSPFVTFAMNVSSFTGKEIREMSGDLAELTWVKMFKPGLKVRWCQLQSKNILFIAPASICHHFLYTGSRSQQRQRHVGAHDMPHLTLKMSLVASREWEERGQRSWLGSFMRQALHICPLFFPLSFHVAKQNGVRRLIEPSFVPQGLCGVPIS